MPRLAACLILCLFAGRAFAADAKTPAAIDPAEAAKDPDFAIQGEYAGEANAAAGDATGKKGLQVIARGGGKFEATGYEGGLPGDGWDRSKQRSTMKGETKDGVVTFSNEALRVTIANGVATVSAADGKKIAELKRVTRQSPTLGAKPPEGAIILFDGKINDFKPGKTDGDLLATERSGGQNSKSKFQSVTLHLEFMLPYMPTASGQGRGNSGVYPQGRYECQVLDSFGLKGENNECGGIYTIADPIVNMCYPPLTWQTYDIEYVAATFEGGKKVKNGTMTVKHNGVLVQDKTELTKNTTSAPVKEGPEPSYLHLQDHGNPIRYRNVWIVEKK